MSTKQKEFDVYVLSQTWLPSFCCLKPKQCPAFLNSAEAWAGNHFVLHGLWPSHSNGEWPSFCKSKYNNYPADKISEQVPPLATKISPSLKQSPHFALHEWKKHGSCALLENPGDYFSESLRAHIGVPGRTMDRGTPELLVKNPGESVRSAELRAAYHRAVGLKCMSKCVLQEVVTCYERRADNNKVGKQIDCPPAILSKNDSCKSCEEIFINVLGSCKMPNGKQEPVSAQVDTSSESAEVETA